MSKIYYISKKFTKKSKSDLTPWAVQTRIHYLELENQKLKGYFDLYIQNIDKCNRTGEFDRALLCEMSPTQPNQRQKFYETDWLTYDLWNETKDIEQLVKFTMQKTDLIYNQIQKNKKEIQTLQKINYTKKYDFDSETIQDILDRVYIVDIMSYFGHREVFTRGNEYVYISPFNNSKKARFYVNVDKKLFHCFQTGEKGNAYSLAQKLGGFDNKQTVEFLKKLS